MLRHQKGGQQTTRNNISKKNVQWWEIYRFAGVIYISRVRRLLWTFETVLGDEISPQNLTTRTDGRYSSWFIVERRIQHYSMYTWGFTRQEEITATDPQRKKKRNYFYFLAMCQSAAQVKKKKRKKKSNNIEERPGTVILIISEGVKPIIFSGSPLGVQQSKISHLIFYFIYFFFFEFRVTTGSQKEKKNTTGNSRIEPVDYLQCIFACSI